MTENSSGGKKISIAADEDSAGSLLPMLVSGLVLIVLGMIAVAAFS